MAADLAYILKGYELTNTQRVVYGVLDGLSRASAKRGKPYTYIGQKALAERVGVCPRTVYAALKALQGEGLIMVKRRGQGKNNAIYVLSPSATREERQITRLICESRKAKIAVPPINSQRVNNTIDYQSIPTKEDNAATPQIKNSVSVARSKGKPTNKRPRINYEEKKKAKQRYKEYLYLRLKVNELKEEWIWVNDIDRLNNDIDSIEKIIELIASIAAGKGKIMVNGALLTSQAWWYGVKNITQDRVIETLRRVNDAKSVKNRKAYLLASLYNDGIQEVISV